MTMPSTETSNSHSSGNPTKKSTKSKDAAAPSAASAASTNKKKVLPLHLAEELMDREFPRLPPDHVIPVMTDYEMQILISATRTYEQGRVQNTIEALHAQLKEHHAVLEELDTVKRKYDKWKRRCEDLEQRVEQLKKRDGKSSLEGSERSGGNESYASSRLSVLKPRKEVEQQNEIQKLRQKLEFMQRENEDLQSQNTSLLKELSDWKSKQNQKEEAAGATSTQPQPTPKELQELTEELTALKQYKEQTQKQTSAQLQQHNAQLSQIAEKEDRISSLEHEVIELKLNFATAKSAVDHEQLSVTRLNLELGKVKLENEDLKRRWREWNANNGNVDSEVPTFQNNGDGNVNVSNKFGRRPSRMDRSHSLVAAADLRDSGNSTNSAKTDGGAFSLNTDNENRRASLNFGIMGSWASFLRSKETSANNLHSSSSTSHNQSNENWAAHNSNGANSTNVSGSNASNNSLSRSGKNSVHSVNRVSSAIYTATIPTKSASPDKNNGEESILKFHNDAQSIQNEGGNIFSSGGVEGNNGTAGGKQHRALKSEGYTSLSSEQGGGAIAGSTGHTRGASTGGVGLGRNILNSFTKNWMNNSNSNLNQHQQKKQQHSPTSHLPPTQEEQQSQRVQQTQTLQGQGEHQDHPLKGISKEGLEGKGKFGWM